MLDSPYLFMEVAAFPKAFVQFIAFTSVVFFIGAIAPDAKELAYRDTVLEPFRMVTVCS